MSAFNVVRFRVKLGAEQQFIDAHRQMKPKFKGFVSANLVKTGDQTFCLIGEWRNFQSIVDARPEMIGLLDGMRDLLEDLGGGLGITDPASGESVARLVQRSATKKSGKTKSKSRDKKGKDKKDKKKKKKKKDKRKGKAKK